MLFDTKHPLLTGMVQKHKQSCGTKRLRYAYVLESVLKLTYTDVEQVKVFKADGLIPRQYTPFKYPTQYGEITLHARNPMVGDWFYIVISFFKDGMVYEITIPNYTRIPTRVYYGRNGRLINGILEYIIEFNRKRMNEHV